MVVPVKEKEVEKITLSNENHGNILVRPNEVSTYLFDDVTPVHWWMYPCLVSSGMYVWVLLFLIEGYKYKK